jgi:predicted nucleotidyltransferase
VKRIEKIKNSNNIKGKKEEKKDLDLLECLFGKTRRLILALLFGHTDESFHLQKILRLTGVFPGAAQREVARLSDAGIILRSAKENQVLFQANPRCPIYNEIKGIITKTAGIADVLRSALTPLGPSIRLALIYGSVALGKAVKESDVDLLVIGDVRFSDIVERLSPAQTALAREINPVVLSIEEYKRRTIEGDHFLVAVLKTALIPVVGELDELNRLAEKRLDR